MDMGILHPTSLQSNLFLLQERPCQSTRNNELSAMTQKTSQKTRNNVLYPQVFPLPHVFPSSVREPTKPQDTRYS
jgi:hypothetical protein